MYNVVSKTFTGFASLVTASLLLASPVNATLLIEQYASGDATPGSLGSWSLTDFDVVNGGQIGVGTSTLNAPSGDAITFVDAAGEELELNRNLADNVSWWNNGETSDYDVFTTDENLITILLPENTFAFSFSVGADLSSNYANAWLIATETDGLGIDSHYNFNVNRNNTPGFGIYSEIAADGSCSALTSVTIEPDYWGVGNFSINQSGLGCLAPLPNSVPEPAGTALFGLGLVTLLFGRRRSQRISPIKI
ncbi:MAG: PEP-CTERM sorting domain-containing protein [Pseudomonadales bacterium]|nr:PEP-CTERM sorting domain-containing protein [Pseudomonadales bacterium]